MESTQPLSPDFFVQAFSTMPAGQIIFLALAAITWLIGSNVLVSYHYKRLGKSWASGFKPFVFPFTKFNAKEWLILFILFLLTAFFGITAISWQ
jgi:hypothetical protein